MERRKGTTTTSSLLNLVQIGQWSPVYLIAIVFCALFTWSVLSLSWHRYDLHQSLVIDSFNRNASNSTSHSMPVVLPSEPLQPPLDRRDRIIQALQQQYHKDCGADLTSESILNRGLIAQIESSDEFTGVLVGHEMWNSLILEELVNPFRFYPDQTVSDPFPFTVLSYGKRLEQGRALLRRIGADRVDFVSYPSLEVAFENRQYLSKFLFREAENMTWANFTTEFSGKLEGYLLSTLNQWMIFERLVDGTYPDDEIFIIEDDMFMVPDFDRKMKALRSQLTTLSWDVVFVGTCFGIRSWTPATQNLFVASSSRCFNAVLLKASVARRILEAGACVDTFAAVDHLFNHYISNLNLNVFYVYPPLAYEQSKNEIQYPC